MYILEDGGKKWARNEVVDRQDQLDGRATTDGAGDSFMSAITVAIFLSYSSSAAAGELYNACTSGASNMEGRKEGKEEKQTLNLKNLNEINTSNKSASTATNRQFTGTRTDISPCGVFSIILKIIIAQ